MDVVAGIDPGLDGGVAVLDCLSNAVESSLLPTHEGGRGREIDPVWLSAWLTARDVTHCVLEISHAMPDQGIVGAFNYGRGYGAIIATLRLCQIKIEFVEPAKWKRHYGLVNVKGQPKKSQRELKAMAVCKALELWPCMEQQLTRVKDNHRAEAALMAGWFKHRRD